MKQFQEKNAKMMELVKHKEIYCDLPCFVLWMSFLLMGGHCFLDLPFDVGMFYFGIYACGFLFTLAYLQSERKVYHQILGRKALAMGCPVVTRYENHQGEWGYYSYVLVNALAFTRLLSCTWEDVPVALSLDEGKAGLFSRKYCIEKVARKEEVGRSFLPDYSVESVRSEKMTARFFTKKSITT